MCLAKFRKDIEKEAESVVIRREKRTEPKDFYEIFLQKVSSVSKSRFHCRTAQVPASTGYILF